MLALLCLCLNGLILLLSLRPIDNKFTANFKNKYELTTEQKEALVGIILADGFIERAKPTYNARLTVEQAYPDQESYLLSIRNLFAPLIKMEPFIVSRKADPRTGKVYKSILVKTLSFPCLNFYHDLFYICKNKVVPSNIKDLLTPRGLAHLVMGAQARFYI